MESVKKVFKISAVISTVVLTYGVLIGSELIYLGMFFGSLLSMLCFYMLCEEAKKSIRSHSPMKSSVIGYLKRYLIYGIYMGVMTYYFGLPMLISSAIGLLNTKISIFIMVLSDNILIFKEKYLK
ncbi:MAG: ATP synthase subunit I [Fusobacteriaceae bacterium]